VPQNTLYYIYSYIYQAEYFFVLGNNKRTTRKPSKTQCCIGNRRALDTKVLSPLLVFVTQLSLTTEQGRCRHCYFVSGDGIIAFPGTDTLLEIVTYALYVTPTTEHIRRYKLLVAQPDADLAVGFTTSFLFGIIDLT
jgi:hypothetical protein